jgi:hypothetical protein
LTKSIDALATALCPPQQEPAKRSLTRLFGPKAGAAQLKPSH